MPRADATTHWATRRAFLLGGTGWLASTACTGNPSQNGGEEAGANVSAHPCSRRVARARAPYRALEKAFCSDVHHESVVGASMAIADAGRIVHTSTHGVRCQGQFGAVEASTAFRIGSITKAFTGALAARLAGAGRLDLDMKVSRILDDVRLEPTSFAERLSLFHLLTHTGGLVDESHGETKGLPNRVRFSAPPGEKWDYSNVGYQLAGAVLERVSARPYEQLLADEILRPLALRNTAVATHEAHSSQWSCEHVTVAGRQVPHATDRAFARFAGGVRSVAPAGALVSSASDLVRLAVAGESIALMTSRTAPVGVPGLSYGLGVFVRPLSDGRVWMYHRGNTGTSAAELHWLSHDGFAIAALANVARPLRATVLAALSEFANLPLDAIRTGLTAHP